MFENFPYTNFHDLNLDWLLKTTKQVFDNEMTQNERIEEIDSRSKIAEHNAEVAKKDAALARAEIESIPGVVPKPTFITVGERGCMFTNVVDAVEFAKTYYTDGSGYSSRVCIVISPGEYTGSIDLLNNSGIDLCAPAGGVAIIDDTGYPVCALRVTGQFTAYGITFISNNATAYAVHIESQGSEQRGEQSFINCLFNGVNAGIGIGSGAGMSQRLNNCTVYGGNSSVYLHNNPADSIEGYGQFTMTNCFNNSQFLLDDYGDSETSTATSSLYCHITNTRFNNVTFRKMNGSGSAETILHYVPFNTHVALSGTCALNSPEHLNYMRPDIDTPIHCYAYCDEHGAFEVAGLNSYLYDIETLYTITIDHDPDIGAVSAPTVMTAGYFNSIMQIADNNMANRHIDWVYKIKPKQ